MLFNSYAFILVFLPLTLTGYYLIPLSTFQLVFLLLSSIAFYAYWSFKYVFLLLFTVILDFYIAKAISITPEKTKRTRLLLTSVCTNLAILGFFKYYNLLASTMNDISSLSGIPLHVLPILGMALPIGISFYTFQSMSYVIDVYRGVSDAHANLLSFAGYVTLFPHQISGPLVRHNVIVPQLESQKTYTFNVANFWRGWSFFIIGLSKKVLIADLISNVVSPLVANMGHASNLEALLAMLGYTMQLYFDFSGYSDMAVGLGYMMNIQFPQNFNSPYKSRSITEFWQRWHISLSSWLRDYLYISLGGNRGGRLETYKNLLLTMIIGGLWHGAHWTFAFWGLFHGILLALERFFRDRKHRSDRGGPLRWVSTFLLVNIGWIFFRAPDFKTAFVWIKKVFLFGGPLSWDLLSVPERYQDRFFIALILACGIALFGPNTWKKVFEPSVKNAIVLGVLFSLCLMYLSEESPFLYFQF